MKTIFSCVYIYARWPLAALNSRVGFIFRVCGWRHLCVLWHSVVCLLDQHRWTVYFAYTSTHIAVLTFQLIPHSDSICWGFHGHSCCEGYRLMFGVVWPWPGCVKPLWADLMLRKRERRYGSVKQSLKAINVQKDHAYQKHGSDLLGLVIPN